MSTGLDTDYLDRCDDKEEIDRLRAENVALRKSLEATEQREQEAAREQVREVSRLMAELASYKSDHAAIHAELCDLLPKMAAAERKMATMVCRKCKGSKMIIPEKCNAPTGRIPLIPCPVCHPKEGT